MADPKFDPSNVAHVEALARRLGRSPLKWTVREGYGGGFEALLSVRMADWKACQIITYGRKHPQFSEEIRRADLRRLAMQAADMLLDDAVSSVTEG